MKTNYEHQLHQVTNHAQRLIEQGELLEALKKLLAALQLFGNYERLLTLASGAWVSAVDQEGLLETWPEDQRILLQKILILQVKCEISPPIFQHRIAAQHSGGVAGHLDRAAGMLETTLEPLLEGKNVASNSVLMALLLRSKLKRIGQDHISNLHREHLPAFKDGDLRLPYSVIFDSAHFSTNVTDLAHYVRDRREDIFAGTVPLTHLLLLFWLVPQEFEDFTTDWPTIVIKARQKMGSLSGEEASAAKSLAVRFENTPHVSSSLIALARSFKSARETVNVEANAGSLQARAKLERLPSQILSAGWNYASAKCPPLSLIRRRLRVAVCVSGQLRGFRSTLPTWLSLLANIDATIFVNSWDQIGRGTPEPFRFVLPFEGPAFAREYKSIGTDLGLDELRNRYPRFYDHFQISSSVTESELSDFYDTPHVHLDAESQPEFLNFSNSEKMYYKAKQCFDMIERSGEEFDLVIRIRPDKPVTAVAFDWANMFSALKVSPSLYCETAMGIHYGALLMGDQFAIGLPQVSAIYAQTYSRMQTLMDQSLYRMEPELAGHSSFAHICWLSGIDVRKVPIKFGPFREADPMRALDIRHTLVKDSSDRMDEYDRRLIAANALDLKI